MYHRTSYASVAAGTASAGPHTYNSPSRAGIYTHLVNPEIDDPTPRQSAGQSLADDMNVDEPDITSRIMDSRRHSNGIGMMGVLDEPRFIVPSYLRHCRYIERLHAAHKVRLQRHKEARLAPHMPAGLGSRTVSSSSLGLHKTPASHGSRGVIRDGEAQETKEDVLRPLPSRWSETDKCPGLEILADGSEVRFQGVSKAPDDAAAVRSDQPMPKECGIYYFEVTILSRGKEGLIGIGFSGARPNLNRLPGWESESWGYHGDDGFSFACSASGKPYGPKFSARDVIGCGMNFRTGTAFFTKNGIFLGESHIIHAV